MDRLSVRVEFKKAWWVCPGCGQEDFTDLNVGGGNDYTHICSACGKWSNSFREYNGVIQFKPEVYEVISEEDIEAQKQEMFDKWVYGVKNPPPYVEPTAEDLQREIDQKRADLEALMARLPGAE